MMAAEVTPGPVFKAAVPKPLFTSPILPGSPNGLGATFRWDADDDGQRFLIDVNPPNESASAAINVVLNWQAGPKR
jgi:hypothetical protein